MVVKPGDHVPDLTLVKPNGEPLPLSRFLSKPLLLVFLRHLAWIACNAHLGEVAKIHDDITKEGGEVLAVSFAPASRVAAFAAEKSLPFAVVADPTLAAYQAFGLGKTSATTLLRPGVMWGFTRLLARGWLPKAPDKDSDIWQLGGDFIIDRSGIVRYAHPSEDPADRPSRQELLDAFRKATNVS